MSGQVCPKCGAIVDDGVRRCPRCGGLLDFLGSWFETLSPVVLLILGLALLLPGACAAFIGTAILVEGGEYVSIGYYILSVGGLFVFVSVILLRNAVRRHRK